MAKKPARSQPVEIEPVGNLADIEQREFEFQSPFSPTGDQPAAIEALCAHLSAGHPATTLLGVTGSGKTYTMANVIARLNRPTLILAHNKTLATQLFQELREFFPNNAVEYFVSYYDYYQPEAYIPSSDVFIEKDATINERLDKLRHRATRSLLTRSDVIIVSSVSCIYGLGSPELYYGMKLSLEVGEQRERDEILRALTGIQYKRNEADFFRGTFRVRGDVIDVVPAHEDARALRIELFGDEVERLTEIDPLTGEVLGELAKVEVYPKSHYVTPEAMLKQSLVTIEDELEQTLQGMHGSSKLLEAQRLEQRTRYDLELLREIGHCNGIENYSRHLTGRAPGEAPPTLLDYLPQNALLVIDESHASIPQVVGMYRGDRSRKETLVEYGFRLPSALDNRPLRFDEFEALNLQRMFVSATPGKYELEQSAGRVVEQIVRPTGLLDPEIELRPSKGQVHDLKAEIEAAAAKGGRVLVTALTKRMAEDLTDFLLEEGLRAKYMHSDIDTIERSEIIAALRAGEFDVLVGINLLREGLDLPEVVLVGALDADKEGFLRNRTSLIQTCGRAARNVEGRVIFYCDAVTDSIQACLDETKRRREIQTAYNAEHGITPRTIQKTTREGLSSLFADDFVDTVSAGKRVAAAANADKTIATLRKEMLAAADAMDFERAAQLRDEIFELERSALGLGGAEHSAKPKPRRRRRRR